MIKNAPQDAGMEKTIDLKSPTDSVLTGHKIEDRILYPATGYVVLAWRNYEEIHGYSPQSTPIVLTNVQLKRATMLNEGRPTTLFSTLLTGSGQFEFKNNAEVIVSGNISLLQDTVGNSDGTLIGSNEQMVHSSWLSLNADDVYKELRLRGYNYSGAFKGIQRVDNEGKWAEIAWKDNWITFLDTMLQASILTKATRNLSLPVEIEKIAIDPLELFKHLQALKQQAGATSGESVSRNVRARTNAIQ